MFVTLCGLSAADAEIMVREPEFPHDRTFAAGATCITGNPEHTFTGNAVEELIIFLCATIIGRTSRADTRGSLFIGYVSALFCILLP